MLKRFVKSPFLAGTVALSLALCASCSPARETVREGKPGAESAPPPDAAEVRFWAGTPESPPELPYSVADETRGRWLTLFEVTYSPVSAGTVPDAGEEPQ